MIGHGKGARKNKLEFPVRDRPRLLAHHIAEYIKQGGYGERVAHGALLVGLMSAASARMRLGRTVFLGYDKIRFIAPVRFGDTIATEYTIKSVDAEKRRAIAEVTCRN